MADLTDWQIVELYYKPAVERSRQFKQVRPGGTFEPSSPVLPRNEMPHPPLDSPLLKDWFVRTTSPFWGFDRACKEFDIQMKEYKESPPDVWWKALK